MKCLTIRQPWAWLIVNNFKDVENRTWHTPVRGDVLIHAAKGITNKEWIATLDFVWHIDDSHELMLEQQHIIDQQRGHIIGRVTLIESADAHHSPYFVGPYGHVFINPRRCEPFPLKGQLGYFDVPDDIVSQLKWIDK
ncbi:MAG: ASCH domain-containing protein [Casimicrobium sp.]